MIVLRSLVCLTASLLGACSSSEPTNTDARELERRAEPPIVEVEPKQPAAAVREGFGPAIGGSLVALSTVAGRYASEFRYTQDKLITVLGEDGSARLCQTAVDYSRGQVGRLATADGKTRTNEHNSERTFAMAGRWTQDSDGIALTLRFDRVAYDTCEVPKDQVGGNMMSELACFTTPSNTVLASSVLVCAVASDQHWLTDAEHGEASALIPLFCEENLFDALGHIALFAFADVAASAELPAIERLLHSNDSNARLCAAEAAAFTSSLALVPATLQAWTRASTIGDRESIGFRLSDMLESEIGPIGGYANVVSPEFVGFVETAHQRLRTSLGDDAYVWAGAAVDINPLAERLLAKHQRDGRGLSLTERHQFTAATGVSLPYGSSVGAVLDDFIRSGKGAAYQPGHRTFFGHRVP